jgi:hypothetical protein
LVGVAVKLTATPLQMAVADAAMATIGVTEFETVTVIAFELAVATDAQVELEVSTQVTTSPFANVDVV